MDQETAAVRLLMSDRLRDEMDVIDYNNKSINGETAAEERQHNNTGNTYGSGKQQSHLTARGGKHEMSKDFPCEFSILHRLIIVIQQ